MITQEIAPTTSSSSEWNLDFHQHPTSYATHGLHPFAAKCPPPLVAWILQRWSSAGDCVLDPMADEPDGLRGDAPIMITTAVPGGIFLPRSHGRAQVELLGEDLDGILIPPRLRPLPNSPVFVLDTEATRETLRLDGDIPRGVP